MGLPLHLYVYNAEGEDYTWKSTDESVASISQDGVVTTNSVGSCRVYTIVRGKILFCNIKVVNGICGDVNISGNVSLSDAVWLGKYLSGSTRLNQASLINADCYQDGSVTADDLLVLLSYLAMKTNSLPYGA